jgi:hypothetical protein
MKIKKLNEEKNIKNVQNHKGSLSSIISEHSKEITDMTNKYVKASELYSKVKQWVDEAELTGKNAEYAKEALDKMSRMNLENLATYLFNIRLKGEDAKLGSYDAQMKKRKYESLNESVEKTFSQWFDETQSHKDRKYYPFDNYVKTFENAEVLRNATAEDIKNNAHRFYDIYEVDSIDREHAFTFASEELGIDYGVFYNAWLKEKPIDSQQDETLPKNVQKLVLSYLKTANSLLKESTIDLVTKQQLNNVIDMFDSLRNKI